MVAALDGSRWRAAALTLPLAAFIGVALVLPTGWLAARSVYQPLVADSLPETLALLEAWDSQRLPAEAVYRSAAREFQQLLERRAISSVATRVNRERSGMHSAIIRAARQLRGKQPDSWREAMIEVHSAWADAQAWEALRRAGERFTLRHYIHAIDLEQNADGTLVARESGRRIHLSLLGRTLLTSLAVSLICLVLGYPLAYFITHSPPRWANLALLAILLQFWISMLVRTSAWIVMLQSHGLANDLLVATGLVSDDGRLPMIYNMTGTIISTTHAMLPFLVLPLYSVMRSIPPQYARAAASLGANRWQRFVHVYWPLTLPGVAAGTMLVFMLSIGQYVTPTLIGGQSGQFFSNVIDYHMQKTLNWNLAAALNVVLLICALALFVAYSRLIGLKRLQLS